VAQPPISVLVGVIDAALTSLRSRPSSSEAVDALLEVRHLLAPAEEPLPPRPEVRWEESLPDPEPPAEQRHLPV
jgi:hypothetical protein